MQGLIRGLMRMARTKPELLVWGAFVNVVDEYFGNRLTCSVEERGTEVNLNFGGVPIFPKGKAATVTVTVPAGLLKVSRTSIGMKYALQGSNVKFGCGTKAFPHPHIWDNKTPCWGGCEVARLSALFENICNTLTWNNVSNNSMTYGHFTQCECTSALRNDPLPKIAEHQKLVKTKLPYSDEPPAMFFNKHINGYLDIALKQFA